MKTLTKNELSLLIYLECRAVDHGGRVSIEHMNVDDINIAKEWNETGFVNFGRIVAKDHTPAGTYWVTFSEKSWQVAHEERRKRFKRIYDKRTWQTTKEKQQVFCFL